MLFRPNAWCHTGHFFVGGCFIVLFAALLQNGTTFLWLLLYSSVMVAMMVVFVAQTPVLYFSSAHWGILLALFLLVVNPLWSVQPNLSWVTFWKLSLGLWVCLVFSFCRRQYWALLWRGILVSALIAAVWSSVQYITYGQRAGGPQLDVNAFAAILYVGSLIWFGQQWLTSTTWRWHQVVGQFLLLFAMMATFSRGGITAWVIGCLLFVVISLRFRRSFLSLFYYLLIALFAYVSAKFLPLLFGSDIISRHFQDLSSLNARLPQWIAAWTLFLESPWTGTGLGTFSLLYPPLRTEYVSAGHLVHNDYLQLLQEGGIALIALFLVFLLWHVRCLWRALGQALLQKGGPLAAYRMELACLSSVNLLLFTHASINFIFYVDYLNVVIGLIAARMSWLVWRLGYIKPPEKIVLSVITKISLVIAICVLWIKLILIAVPQLWFVEWKKDDEPMMPSAIARVLLTVDPVNTVASESLLQSAYSIMPTLLPLQRQSVFNEAWSQASILKERLPAEPRVYYWLGRLIQHAEALKLQLPNDALNGRSYQALALEKHPGYFPAHIETALALEKSVDAQTALTYLKPHFWRWHQMVSVHMTYQMLDTMVRLAKVSQDAELEHFRAMRDHLYHWINNTTFFRPRYEG